MWVLDLITLQQAEGLIGASYSYDDEIYEYWCKPGDGVREYEHSLDVQQRLEEYRKAVEEGTNIEPIPRSEEYKYNPLYAKECHLGRVNSLSERLDILKQVVGSS